MIGFLPIQSYFDTVKDIQTGTKCPEEFEDLVRAMVIKECLDKIGCTYDKIKEVSKVA